jgi:hypothetical protein
MAGNLELDQADHSPDAFGGLLVRLQALYLPEG